MFYMSWGHLGNLRSKCRGEDLCCHQGMRGYRSSFSTCMLTDLIVLWMTWRCRLCAPISYSSCWRIVNLIILGGEKKMGWPSLGWEILFLLATAVQPQPLTWQVVSTYGKIPKKMCNSDLPGNSAGSADCFTLEGFDAVKTRTTILQRSKGLERLCK